MARDADDMMDILQHATDQLEDGTWTLTGWFEISTLEGDGSITKPECHIVILDKAIPIVKWQRAEVLTAPDIAPVVAAPMV